MRSASLAAIAMIACTPRFSSGELAFESYSASSWHKHRRTLEGEVLEPARCRDCDVAVLVRWETTSCEGHVDNENGGVDDLCDDGAGVGDVAEWELAFRDGLVGGVMVERFYPYVDDVHDVQEGGLDEATGIVHVYVRNEGDPYSVTERGSAVSWAASDSARLQRALRPLARWGDTVALSGMGSS